MFPPFLLVTKYNAINLLPCDDLLIFYWLFVLNENWVDWMRWAGHVARMGEKRNVYRLLVGNPEGKIPLGIPRRRWINNIKMNILEIGLDGVDWIGLAQDRYSWRALVNTVMHLRVP
jgi:hypothetical protein